MTLPGFNAETSLYKTVGHQCFPSAADQSRITPPRPKTESHRRKRANRESNRRTKRHPQCQIAIPQQPPDRANINAEVALFESLRVRI